MLGVIQRVFQELGGVIRAALFARQIAVLLGEDLAQHRRVFGAGEIASAVKPAILCAPVYAR